MGEIVSWLRGYSKPVAILLVIAAAALFVVRAVVEETVRSEFEAERTERELRLTRRSGFEDRLLTRRFNLVAGLSGRLGRVATDINRQHAGRVPSRAIEPRLTAVYEDLTSERVVLGDQFHALLRTMADDVMSLWRAPTPEAADRRSRRIMIVDSQLRDAVEETFRVSEIRP
ncbi:hypothetical protein [Miltoncostaea marina]|uniref:hypothetical protein n=1 Tax=Miltoncostaea marina TaxID=2843215 RepID=UPI001C3C6728|nr:hypothetical protein [Miltoncostaea marina]